MNETLSVQWYLRDFTPCLPPPFPLRVERLVWEEPGGAALAVLSAAWRDPAPDGLAEWAGEMLRRPLEIHAPTGEICWNGFVARVEIRHGRSAVVYDLDRLANRVAALYSPAVHEPPFAGARTLTEWAEDALSLSRYGRKERLLHLAQEDSQRALAARDASLRRDALPQGVPLPLAQPAAPTLRLIGRGWFTTLNWTHLHIPHGCDGFVEPAQTPQSLGRSSSADAMLAQSFQTAYGPFYLLEAGLNLKRSGSPADELVVEVCADSGSLPGSVLAAASLPASALSGGRAWARLRFEQPPLLQAAAPYWLRLRRSGTLNANHYYQLYREGNDAYPAGRLLTWNGSAWADGSGGQSDLNFYLLAGQSRQTRLLELCAPAHGGQFLRGVRLLAELPGLTAYPQPTPQPCGQYLLDLLAAGTTDGRPLSVQVDGQRQLVIQPLPEEDEAEWLIQPDGRLWALSRRPARLGEALAGRRARLTHAAGLRPLLLRRVVWTPADGLRV